MVTGKRKYLGQKLALALAVLCIGAGTRLVTRPSTSKLAEQGQLELARGNIGKAEHLGRVALGQSPRSWQARNLLSQVAEYRRDPMLQLAVLSGVHNDEPIALQARLLEAATALELGLAARAQRASEEALQLQPENLKALDKLIYIAGVRMDNEQLRQLLLRRLKLGGPEQRHVRNLLVIETMIDEELGSTLQRWLEADRSDEQSRLGLARWTVRQGRPGQALALYRDDVQPSRSSVAACLAEAHLMRSDVDKAKSLLEDLPPDEQSSEYWRVLGTLQLELDEPRAAEQSLKRVVAQRPLSPAVRSRYLEALRRLGQETQNRQQANVSRLLDEIADQAVTLNEKSTNTELNCLASKCESVGARAEAEQLYLLVLSRAPENVQAREGASRCRE